MGNNNMTASSGIAAPGVIDTTVNSHAGLLAALRAIVAECSDHPTEKPFSSDSYLPEHLLEAAQRAIDAAVKGGVQ